MVTRSLLLTMLVMACPVADAAETRELTLFTVAMHGIEGEEFVVGTDDPDLIRLCREQLELPVDERDLHVSGAIGDGHGGFNLGREWHHEPGSWQLAEASIELCDGLPSFVDDDLEYWIEAVGSFCPWASYIDAEGVPHPLRSPAAVRIDLVPWVTGLDRPLGVVWPPGDQRRALVIEKAGVIRAVEDGVVRTEPVLDISTRVRSAGSEQGLLGLAVHPGWPERSELFVNYTNQAGDTVVARFAAETAPLIADPASEEILLEVRQPFSNHNGGHLAFGPDGMLWIGTGDGGAGGDPEGNGQDLGSPLGKLLRIDVSSPGGSTVPADNPFAGSPDALPEIWAFGLRNPWRFSFDRATGDLWIGDVGQNEREEIDLEPRRAPGGRNYGWNVMEGSECYNEPTCDDAGLELPVVEYDHSEGCSVTGGFVYRGDEYPILDGMYLFADYCSGRIWALAPGGRFGWAVAEVGSTNDRIVSFGEDPLGELVAVAIDTGSIQRVTAERVPQPPRRASRRVAPSPQELMRD
jgi:glucose/arabinose dehydrogenase